MRSLQVLLVAVTAVLMLENGVPRVEAAPRVRQSLSTVHKTGPGVRYAYSTRHGSSSANTNAVVQPATVQTAVTGTQTKGDLQVTGSARLVPVDHTPEVKKARKSFFSLYDKQARLAAEAPDTDLAGTSAQTQGVAVASNDDDNEHRLTVYYGEEEEEDEEEAEEDEDDEEEDEDEDEEDEDEEEEDSDEEEEDEDEEDSDEEGEDSSSSEEDYGDSSSSEEDGEDSSEEGEDSSEEGEDSSSSSSSSSSEEDAEYGLVWGARGWRYQRIIPGDLRLNLVTPRPVSDTDEVKLAKKKFFELYKTQAEMARNAPDH